MPAKKCCSKSARTEGAEGVVEGNLLDTSYALAWGEHFSLYSAFWKLIKK